MPVLVTLLTLVSTTAGGLFALRHRDRLHLVLGFSAGVILGVIAFDLLPEIFHLVDTTGTSVRVPMVALVVAFLGFHIAEKTVLLHAAHEEEYGTHGDDGAAGDHAPGHVHGHSPHVGLASAVALSLHSFTDGLAIGLAFQVGSKVAIAVAVAVIAHDFADGLNTVSLMLTHGNTRRRALTLLAVDATAPVLGALSTLVVHVPDHFLLVALGAFCGVLLYIGAADILPEAHANHPAGATLTLTVAGAALMYAVLTFAV